MNEQLAESDGTEQRVWSRLMARLETAEANGARAVVVELEKRINALIEQRGYGMTYIASDFEALLDGLRSPTAQPAESVCLSIPSTQRENMTTKPDSIDTLEDRASDFYHEKAVYTEREIIKKMTAFAQSEIERQTPAIIERFKRESGFDAIKFNGECAEQLLREQGIYVGDGGEVVNTKVETLVKALEKIGQCGAGHVCCNVNFHIAQNAIQTVKARRSGGEEKDG